MPWPVRAISIVKWAALALATYIIVSIAFTGFYEKWHLREDNAEYSIARVFDGTVIRPVAYRKLLPDLVDATARLVPERVEAEFHRKSSARDFSFRQQVPLTVSGERRYATRYYLMVAAVFATAIAAFAGFFALGRAVGVAPVPAYAAATMALLAVPLIETKGGYYYDFSEFALFCAFLAAATSRRFYLALLPLALIGEWNKETFIAFIPCAWPLLRETVGGRRAAAVLAGCGAVALGVFTVIRARVDHIPDPRGSVGERLADHWHWLTTPARLFENDISYGVPTPPGVAVLLGLLLAGLIAATWRDLSSPWRQSVLIAAAVNAPLFLLFCAAGELRNLSMLIPAVVVALALLMRGLVNRSAPPVFAT